MDLQLSGKVALVSGSSAGIGFAIAKGLALENVHVILTGRDSMRLKAAVARLKSDTGNEDIQGFEVDFSVAKGIEDLIHKFPEVDILVNNVGIFEPKAFAEITDVDWLKFFEVNVLSGVRLSRAYFGKMLEKNWGRVIFISSESAVQIPSEMIHYGMTKTAQLALSRGLAELTRGTGVTVNSVLPGPTFSEGAGEFVRNLAREQQKPMEQVQKEFFEQVRPSSLLQRFAETDEVAHLVTYLASPLSSATNGAALRADGGVVRSIL